MIRKILLGLLALVGGFFYWRFTQANKPPISAADRARLRLMPLPASLSISPSEVFTFEPVVAVRWEGFRDARMERALQRCLRPLSVRGSFSADTVWKKTIVIRCDSAAAGVQRLVEDESYTLEVTASEIALHAPTPYGILRGLATLSQYAHQQGAYTGGDQRAILAVSIHDRPRYPWRGLMIDVCRHWIPKEAILRNLDAMAAAKLNVLHWHLTEYQAFRIESKVFPKLHALGSGGKYFSQNDVREIVAYAADRGIRVVPEFDMPGHATSWFAGYPSLATTPKAYVPDIKFGVLTPIMNASKEHVYEFLDAFLAEMATLFPDAYIHIGGDEVVMEEWMESDSVRAFMKSNNLADGHALQNYFNKRMQTILARHGKKMIGWDEILHPDLGGAIMVQSWRSHRSLFEAVQQGGSAILSAGYYLDHKLPAGKHYQVDPDVLPGAVTIAPDSVHWQQYDLDLYVSDNPMKMALVLYGQGDERRGVFSMLESATGFEKASLKNGALTFTFASEFGNVDVDGTIEKDSIRGTMSLGLLSFPFKGARSGGNDMPGTKPPAVEQIKPLTPEEKARIRGGEAALWTEVVSEKNVDSRLWPRLAAIAEKLWSPAVLTKDTDDMYRRLEYFSEHLKTLGIRHESGPAEILCALAGSKPCAPVQTLATALEEVKYYNRLGVNKELTTLTPLDEMVDGVQPESYHALVLQHNVEMFLTDTTTDWSEEVESGLRRYIDNDSLFRETAKGNPRLEKILPLSAGVKEAALMGLEAARAVQRGERIAPTRKEAMRQRLKALEASHEGMIIAILPACRKLVDGIKE